MISNAELLSRLSKGDESAADLLVENNMGLVYSIASKFHNRGYDNEDLIQIGALGLIKAVRKFDFTFNVQFSTYAVPMILGEIKRFLRDDGAIKVSRSLKEIAIKGKSTEEMLRKRLGRNPTIKEIAVQCQVDECDLLEAFDACIPPESLESTPSSDDNGLTVMGLVSSGNEVETIVDKLYIKEIMKDLTQREKEIIILRYFKGKTQSEIAERIGVSQVQISRIEKKALLKMRQMDT